MFALPARRLSGRWHFVLVAALACLLADLVLRVRPTGYFGGSSDDQRYLEAALRWIADGPHAGHTHWALRHPLVLSTVAAFRVFGVSMDTVQLVPRLYGDVLFGFSTAMMARHAGLRAGAIWLAVALLTPAFHQVSTSLGVDIAEVTFAAIAGWLMWEARGGGRHAPLAMVGAGAALALAVMTREIASCLLVVYGVAWATGRVPRASLPWLLAGFVPPLLLDNLWLWQQTGDPLWRFHVDAAHTGIYSAHLMGGVYHGRVLLNPDLAARWIPAGPVKLHWTIDPLLNFLAAPEFGLVFLGWAVLAFSPPTRAPRGSAIARAMPWLFGVALACYVVVTWVLTLRPQPRYYLIGLYAATIAVALLLAHPSRGRAAAWIKRGVVALIVLCGGITILLSPDRQRDVRLYLPWLARHPGVHLHLDTENRRRAAFPALLAGVNDRLSSAPTRVGDWAVHADADPSLPGKWVTVETLPGPHLFPYVNAPRNVVIERRVP
jgi:hypothetical protein